MSLLLEALKKAEEAKKQALAKTRVQGHALAQQTDTRAHMSTELTLESIAPAEHSDDTLLDQNDDVTNTQEMPEPVNPPLNNGIVTDSLAPCIPLTGTINIVSSNSSSDKTTEPPAPPPLQQAAAASNTPPPSMLSLEALERPVSDKPLEVEIKSAAYNQVSAKRIISVASRPKSKQRLIFIGAALAGVVFSSMTYYYSQSPAGIPQATVEPLAADTLTELNTEDGTVSNQDIPAAVIPTSAVAAPDVTHLSSQNAETIDDTTVKINAKPTVAVKTAAVNIPTKPAASMPTTSTVEAAVTKSLSPPPVAAKPKPVNQAAAQEIAKHRAQPQEKPHATFVKQEQADPIFALLEQAYKQYQSGNFQNAEKYYNQVLVQELTNRDARLGLAAIAMKYNDPAQAHHHYKFLLKINPKDSVALTGAMSSITGANALKSESQIKLLLDQEPQAAHLHFTLGNLLVEQSRWADAQQAYFQAYRYDPSNADYAYNLAISLDNLGQQKTALKYYKISLEISKNHNASFDVGSLLQRINALSGIN